MKTSTLIKSILFLALSVFTLSSCSNKRLTKEDVQKEVSEAEEAKEEAKEETQEAIEAREQFYGDNKETQLKELNERSKNIDKRISELKSTAGKSENNDASESIKSAINSLEAEKQSLNREMESVKEIKEEDWSESYETLNEAISNIETELEKINRSLEEQ